MWLRLNKVRLGKLALSYPISLPGLKKARYDIPECVRSGSRISGSGERAGIRVNPTGWYSGHSQRTDTTTACLDPLTVDGWRNSTSRMRKTQSQQY